MHTLIDEKRTEHERLTGIVRLFPQKRVLVVGDLVADQFLFGGIARVSREAPVLILRYEKTETTPGGAANCAVNLAGLDAGVQLIGAVGKDEPGQALLASLEHRGVSTSDILNVEGYRTPTKVRILAGQLHSTRQQVLRIDYEGSPLSDSDARAEMVERVRTAAESADAVILSDYNYGTIDSYIADFVRRIAGERSVPVLVDSRFRLTEFHGFTTATPNEDEVEQTIGRQFSTAHDLQAASENLRSKLDYKALLVTRGSNGMLLTQNDGTAVQIPAVGAREPVDVTGAGDTVIATYALALACGATFEDAARLANHAGGTVVMKRGTASLTREELLSSVLRFSSNV
jgi:D-glycero-beta-D-manno-heptose-7-phosphate kinase